MEMNPEIWPELLLKYGPYAVLALFVLWVIPRSSKRLHRLTTTAPKSVQVAATIAVATSWVVVLLMVGYIMLKWSPVRVYGGQLGILKNSERVAPLSDNLYVKSEGILKTDQERWEFVLVSRESDIERNETVDFAYFWGQGDDEYTLYSIPVKIVADGKNKYFSFTHTKPMGMFTWNNNKWTLTSADGAREKIFSIAMRWNAYAEDDEELRAISKRLKSPNRLTRAKAQMALRDLSDMELASLKKVTDEKKAVLLIKKEQERRK